MRRVIVTSMVTLDGVVQAPGGADEDPSGGFEYGGWIVPHGDEFSGKVMRKQMEGSFDLLLGRRTYDIFASYWPRYVDPEHPIAKRFNGATKYVATRTPLTTIWNSTVVLADNVIDALSRLKSEEGPELHVYGSRNFVQTLLAHDLVDELWLKIYPITLGVGKRLFEEGTKPAAFALIECMSSPNGIVFATYRRSGDVVTGSFPK